MKKNIVTILLLILTASVFCGCSGVDFNGSTQSGKLKIVTTIFPQYDFARQVAGDKAEISMLLYPGAESHSFEPTPQDIIKIREADLFIYTGGESDTWIKNLIKSSELNSSKVISLMETVEQDDLIFEEHSHEGNMHNDYYDEHVWTSVENAQEVVEEICERLCVIDPSNKAYYELNAKNYISRLEELDAKFENIVEASKRKEIVFGDRFPFKYFAHEYGLNYYSAYPGCSAEAEPDAQTVSDLIDLVNNRKIPIVFYVEFSNEKTADVICEATNAKKLLFHSCHNVTKAEFESGITYIDLMNKNAENLREGLN